MTKSSNLNLPSLYPYIFKVGVRDNAILKSLRIETEKQQYSQMQIAPEQGQLMALLVKLIGAEKIVEIGTYTGYSSLCMALALPDHGKIICCDISEQWTQIAKKYWRLSGVENKIELKLAPALDTLNQMLKTESGTVDLVFIDADKANYDSYYEKALSLIRCNGLLIIDNTLWGGSVIDPNKQDDDTCAIRALNEKIKKDERVDFSLLPMADGITLVRKV